MLLRGLLGLGSLILFLLLLLLLLLFNIRCCLSRSFDNSISDESLLDGSPHCYPHPVFSSGSYLPCTVAAQFDILVSAASLLMRHFQLVYLVEPIRIIWSARAICCRSS